MRGRRKIQARSLIIGEKEQLIALDWPAHRPAEVIPALARRGQPVKVVRPFVRVKEIVAENLERRPVKLVRSRLQVDVDHASQELSELSTRIIGDHLGFLNSLNAGGISDVVVDKFHIFHAVQQIIIRLLAIPIQVRPRRVEGLQAAIEGRRADGH